VFQPHHDHAFSRPTFFLFRQLCHHVVEWQQVYAHDKEWEDQRQILGNHRLHLIERFSFHRQESQLNLVCAATCHEHDQQVGHVEHKLGRPVPKRAIPRPPVGTLGC